VRPSKSCLTSSKRWNTRWLHRPRKGPFYHAKAKHLSPPTAVTVPIITTPPRAEKEVTVLDWCFSSTHYYRLLAAAENPPRGRSAPARKRRIYRLLQAETGSPSRGQPRPARKRRKIYRVRIRWVRIGRQHHPRPSPPTQVQDLGRVRAHASRLLLERWRFSSAPKGARDRPARSAFLTSTLLRELANPTTPIPCMWKQGFAVTRGFSNQPHFC
jgi:hypothetical protein